MKVLHMFDSLNRGGTEMLALDVCRNARANNLDLIFVATGGGDLENDFRYTETPFIRLQRRFPLDLQLAARLRKIIKEHEVQIVHTHQAVEALHAYLATRGTKAKQVLSFHTCATDFKNRRALKFLAPRMDANVAVSGDLLKCLETLEYLDTSRNFQVVYNGVDGRRLQCATADRVRNELGLATGDVLLGMVGNFYGGVRKDQMTVCRALAQLFRYAPRAHFVFVGNRSSDAPEVYDDCVSFCRQEGIADRVRFLGRRADIPEVLSALDVFVMSSLWEGMPLAVIEAMMMGRAVVVSDIESLLEVTGGGVYALTFRTQNADDLAQKLSMLINDQARRARLGAQAKEWATQQFSIESHLANLMKLYTALMDCA